MALAPVILFFFELCEWAGPLVRGPGADVCVLTGLEHEIYKISSLTVLIF